MKSLQVLTCKLGDPSIAKIILGQSPPSSTYNNAGEGEPFFQGKADFGLLYPKVRIWCNDGKKFAKAGDILMSVRAPVGDVNIATEECVIGRGVAAIRAGNKINPWYLYFALIYLRPVIDSRSTGSTFASINKQILKDIDVPIFSYSDQPIIGNLLRYVVEKIEQENVSIASTLKLKHATMQHVFTRGLRGEPQKQTAIGMMPDSWELGVFKDIREWLQYGTSTHCTLQEKNYPVLRIPNIKDGKINIGELKYCDLSDDKANNYFLKNGDLIFIRTNGALDRLGSCAVYDGQPDKALFASYLIRARLKSNVIPKFVAYFYASQIGTALVAGRATPAADGKFNLNTGIIDSLPIPIPPTLTEQQSIVTLLDTLDQKISLHQQKRAVLQELFQSLLRQLMTGQLRAGELNLSALATEP